MKLLSLLLLLALGSSTYSAAPATQHLIEFREVKKQPSSETVRMEFSHRNSEHREVLHVSGTPSLTEADIKKASVARDPLNNSTIIEISFNEAGTKKLTELTAANIGERLAIIVEGVIHSAPVIAQPITGGRAHITGKFTEEEAKALVDRIRSTSRKSDWAE